MRRYPHVAVALVALAGLSAAMLTVASKAAAQEPVPQASSCDPVVSRMAFPSVLLLGETTAITLNFNLNCPVVRSPLHVVLVLDGSAAMAGDPGRHLSQTAELIVQGLSLIHISEPTRPY